MFDIGATELLLIIIVAVVVIGPKDLPLALRTAGRWMGKMRRISGHFRAGVENMIREAEVEDMEKKWKDQNAQIMAQYPDAGPASASAEARTEDETGISDPSAPTPHDPPVADKASEPQLPLGGPPPPP